CNSNVCVCVDNINIFFFSSRRRHTRFSRDWSSDVCSSDLYNAFVGLPIIPVRTVDGRGWGGPVAGMNDRQNPVRELEDSKQNGYHFSRIFGNFFADVQLMPGLIFRSNFGIDYGNYTRRAWDKRYQSGYLESDISKVI